MPISSNYYLNAPTFFDATAIFDDSGLTICSADGYYSDGTIVRQQIGCVLASEQVCACLLPYGSSVNPSRNIGEACGQEIPIVYYTNSLTLPYLIAGNSVYQDSGGTNPLLDGWYVMQTDVPACPLAYEVLGGIVVNTYNCCA